jgi:excinuclease UvrABC nuclease subunit
VPKPKDLAGQQMRMLQGINGIGPGRAQDLLAHFGTPAAVVNATLEALTAAVGPATAEKVFTFVRQNAVQRQGRGAA